MLYRIATVIVLSLCCASVPAGAKKQPVDQRKHVAHKVVRVTDAKAKRPAEVSVAISPKDAKHVVAVSLDSNRGLTTNFAYASKDGGLTWKTTALPNPHRRIQGDDAIAFGPDGTFYHTCIAFMGIRLRRPTLAVNGIFCNTSKDGVRWSKSVPVVDHVNTVEPFEDKPYLCVDTVADSPHRSNVYVGWTRFDVYGSKKPEHKSHIYFSRSRDGGKTFSPMHRISDKHGNAIDNSGTVEGAMPTVGPKGEVYVAWAGPEGIVVDKSTDGGRTFGKDTFVAKNPGGWSFKAKGLARHNGMPVIGTDLSKGPHCGSIYICWLDKRHGDSDVFLSKSRDGGKTWSKPLRVNDDAKGNGKEQLFVWMSVDPADGSINLAFFDRRNSSDTLTGVTLARSVDGGKTFVNYKVDQKPFRCYPDVFFGDYIGIAAREGRVAALYMHFIGRRQLAISAALFQFQPRTHNAVVAK